MLRLYVQGHLAPARAGKGHGGHAAPNTPTVPCRDERAADVEVAEELRRATAAIEVVQHEVRPPRIGALRIELHDRAVEILRARLDDDETDLDAEAVADLVSAANE